MSCSALLFSFIVSQQFRTFGLKEEEIANEIVFIGHNLTSRTKSYLLEGTMDIVIHLNVRIVAEQTVDALVSHLENRRFQPSPILTGVITRENIIGATFA